MAVAFTARANIGATATSVTTASFTPSANSRLFAICAARPAAAAIPTISDSLGGSWTLLPSSNIDSGQIAGAIYYQDIGSSPAAMTVTVASVSSTQVGVMCFDVTGASADLSNFQTDTDTAGDPTLTLGAVSAGSFGIAAYIGNAGGAPTGLPTGYSLVYSSAPATNLRMALYTDATSPGTTQAWTTPSTDSIGYGLEIKEAASNVAVGSSAGGATVSAVGGSTVTTVGSVAGAAAASAVGQIMSANDNDTLCMVFNRRRARR